VTDQHLIHNGTDWTAFVYGDPIGWVEATEGLFSTNKSNEIARSKKGPPTTFIGDKRFVDAGVFAEWKRRLSMGLIEITVQDLREVREAGKGNPKGRAARLAAQVEGAA